MKIRDIFVRLIGLAIAAVGFIVIVNGQGNQAVVLVGAIIVTFGAGLFVVGDVASE